MHFYFRANAWITASGSSKLGASNRFQYNETRADVCYVRE